MPKSRIILALGFFIALLPVLGFPNSWDHFFDTATGLLIVLLSVLISVDRRLMLKAKAEKRTQRKRAVFAPAPQEETPTPDVAPVPEPEPAPQFVRPEPVVDMPEAIIEVPRPFVEERVEAMPEVRPHRRRAPRKVRVLDGDASSASSVAATEAPAVEETFDTTEFS